MFCFSEEIMKDILFQEEDFVFSYRIAGVLIRDGKMLLQRMGRDYAFVGGHVSAMETTAGTLVREFREEIHADIAVDRLLAVGEVFFPWGEKPCHQVNFIYAVHLTDESRIPFEGVFHGYDELGGERFDLDFCWVPLEELPNVNVYPLGVMDHILSGSRDVLHFIYRE